jgi:hypothetical protein
MEGMSRDDGRRRAIYTIAGLGLCCAACFNPEPPIGPEKIPAMYVLNQDGAVDSIQLNRDGTMVRTFSFEGHQWSQTGHWSSTVKRETNSPDHLHVLFADLEPHCLSDNAQASTSKSVLCSSDGRSYSEMCDRWRSLCFGDWKVRYRHEGGFSNTSLWDLIP